MHTMHNEVGFLVMRSPQIQFRSVNEVHKESHDNFYSLQ